MNDVSPDLTTSEALDEDQEKLNDELSYFNEIKGMLLIDERYRDKFVVIKKQVGIDTPRVALVTNNQYWHQEIIIQ